MVILLKHEAPKSLKPLQVLVLSLPVLAEMRIVTILNNPKV